MYQGEAQQCLGAVQGKCIWCHTCLPGSTTGTGTGTGTAPLQGEAADQTNSLLGAAKVPGAAHASSAPPGGYFAKEGSLWRRFLWLGIKVPGSRPDSQYLAVAQPGSAAGFVCQAAAGGGREGEPGACAGGGLGCASAGMLGSALLPLPRKHGNGGQASWHPGKGRWEASMLGKGVDHEQDSHSPTVTGKQLFFVQQWKRCPFVQLGRCSIPASGSMAGPSLS